MISRADVISARTDSAQKTKELAREISAHLKPGDVILFSGSLGVGKTTFIQGLASALGVVENVLSPTFVIAHQYEGRFPVHHLDLYRVDDIAELEPMLRELSDSGGILLVEWGEKLLAERGENLAERGENLEENLEEDNESTPPEYLKITISFLENTGGDKNTGGDVDADKRLIQLELTGKCWTDRKEALDKCCQK